MVLKRMKKERKNLLSAAICVKFPWKMAVQRLSTACEGSATSVVGDPKPVSYLFYILLWLPLFASLDK